MTATVQLEDDRQADVDQEPVVMLCLFRTCSWASEEVQTAPLGVREALMTRHLFRDHREELSVLGYLATSAGLL